LNANNMLAILITSGTYCVCVNSERIWPLVWFTIEE